MEVPTQELHRRPTLSHFMSRVESSSNLRDLLKVRQDDAEAAAAARRRGAEATRTLATILACEKRDLTSDPSSSSSSVSSVVNRTLLDIIRDEQEPNNRMMPNGAVGPEGLGGGPGGNRGGGGGGAVVVNWKALRDRLRLRRANEVLQASAAFGEGSQRREEEEREQGTGLQPVSGAEGPRPLVSILEAPPAASEGSPAAPERAAPTTTAGTTTGDDTASTSTPRSQDGQQPRVTNTPAASSNSRPQPPPPARQPRPQQPRQRPPQSDEPTRVSLMALLEQADRTGGGVGGPSFAAAVVGLVQEDAHGEEGHDHRPAGAGGADESLLCCVCMVRNKGAAFIPCGHTFCRLCTRELWVSRGTCPLCNGFILEILDIF